MGLHPLLLVHPELNPHQRRIIVVLKIQSAFGAAEIFSHVAGEIHRGVVLDARDGHFLDPFKRKVHIEPVLAVINVAVIVDFIHLSILPARVVHHHNIPPVQVLAHIFLIEGFRGVFLRGDNLSLAVAAGPFELCRRLAEAEGKDAVDLPEHLNFLSLEGLESRRSVRTAHLGGHSVVGLAKPQTVLAEFEFENHRHLGGVVAAECLRHSLGRHDSILCHKVRDSGELPAVAKRVAEKPVHLTVVVRKVPRVNYSLKEEVCLFELVVEENIVLRKLELGKVVGVYHLGSEDIKPGEKPASSGRFLVGDALGLHPVGKMGVNHSGVLAVYGESCD